ncbi:MAG: ATP synthase F1 subunit gamma [Acidobacteriaceae bacterium]
MATNSREIRRRIKSVKNIGQITKAMELVSAAKMRKSQSLALSSRPYSTMSSELLNNLAKAGNIASHPLVSRPPKPDGTAKGKTLVILITSDRGLAGAFNANAINEALRLVRSVENAEFDFITVGKKGAEVLRKMKQNLVAAFNTIDRKITVFDAKPISKIAIDDFLNYTYDSVFVIYSHFVSTLVQKPTLLKLLPIETKGESAAEEFLFEPSAKKVLDHLVYRAIEFTVYQCLVETSASEHSARMVAMRNASQSSSDLIEDLTLTANQTRQAGITRELAEISAAKIAMED